MHRNITTVLISVMISASLTFIETGHADEPEVIALSPTIGPEIDKSEYEAYGLFPDIEGFLSARIFRRGESDYRLEYSYRDEHGMERHKSRRISAQAFELTRQHVRLVEQHQHVEVQPALTDSVEARVIYRIGLQFATQKRYEGTALLFSELLRRHPRSAQARRVQDIAADLDELRRNKKVLFRKGALIDHSGRTQLLIFSGYYGLWLGIATPIWLEANSPQAFALGLLFVPPASIWITHAVTKQASVSSGRATMISLGAHLGTWQGFGWAGVANKEGPAVTGMGEVLGLTGLAAATLLTNKIDFSEGHAALTSSGLQWGAWAGLVLGVIAGAEDENLLRATLIGSDLAVLGLGLATKDVRMSKTRVRLLNLAGAVGAVFGFGLDLLFEVDEASTAFAIAGLGSAGGLALGSRWTKNFDKGRELSYRQRRVPGIQLGRSDVHVSGPLLTLVRSPHRPGRVVPALAMQVAF